MSKVNVFCLPFAGGSSYSYNGYLPYATLIRLVPLELPGRGTRFSEPLPDTMEEMVEDIFRQIQSRLHTPYAIYGHSMGAMLGYLLTKRILSEGLPAPLHLFFSGRAAPGIVQSSAFIHTLPREEFFVALRNLGGFSDDLLENEDLNDLFEPVIRADLRSLASYRYEATAPFNIPITVMIGLEESITFEEAAAWQKETTASVAVTEFTGDHFFINRHPAQIIEIMTGLLLREAKMQSPETFYGNTLRFKN